MECEPNVSEDGDLIVLTCTGGVTSADEDGEDLTGAKFWLAFLAGRRGWKTGGGSAAGAGVRVLLCVMNEDKPIAGGVLTGLSAARGGEFAQSTVGQGAICCPIISLTGATCGTADADLLRVCEYGRKDEMEATFVRKPPLFLTGLSNASTRFRTGLSPRLLARAILSAVVGER